MRKQGDRVRIVAELINAADGIELWTQTFDRELKDIFAVQEEIAAAVASSLKVTLLGADERSSANPATRIQKRTTPISRAIIISSAAISRIIAKRLVTMTKRSVSIRITPSLMQSVPKHGL